MLQDLIKFTTSWLLTQASSYTKHNPQTYVGVTLHGFREDHYENGC